MPISIVFLTPDFKYRIEEGIIEIHNTHSPIWKSYITAEKACYINDISVEKEQFLKAFKKDYPKIYKSRHFKKYFKIKS